MKNRYDAFVLLSLKLVYDSYLYKLNVKNFPDISFYIAAIFEN